MADRDLVLRNAVELGWHVGYYKFSLSVIGGRSNKNLDEQDCQVLNVVRDRLENLLDFFELHIAVKYPASPAEARSLSEKELNTGGDLDLAGSIYDACRIRHGSEVGNLFSLGQQTMIYGLLAQYTEPEVLDAAKESEKAIRNLINNLGISQTRADELLQNPEKLMEVSWVVSRLFDAPDSALCYQTGDGVRTQLNIDWDGPCFDLPEQEVVILVPGGFQVGNELILKNTGPGSMKINRIDLEPIIHKHLNTQSGMEMTVNIEVLRFKSEERSDLGLKLTQSGSGNWVIDTPFVIQEGEVVVLPGLTLFYDEDDEIASGEIRRLVGLSTLELQYHIAVFAEQETCSQTLAAPLRVFYSVEWGGDGGIGSLLRRMTDVEETAKEALGESYEKIRQFDYDTRNYIADSLNEELEQEKLEELADEIEPYDQAITRNPADPGVHHARGRFLLEMGLPSAALASLEQSVSLGNDSAEVRLDRGKAFLELERNEEALQSFDDVLEMHPEASTFVLKGISLVNLGRSQDALDAYDHAIRLDEKCAAAHYRRGLALITLEREDDALKAFTLASDMVPDFAEAYIGQALALAGRGPEEEFLKAVEKALSYGFADWERFYPVERLLDEETRVKFRHLITSYQVPEKGGSAIPEKKTILFLAPDPSDTDRLRLGREARKIQEKIQMSSMRELFHLELCFAVKPEDISQAILDVKPSIIHFSGHGSGFGDLFFEDETGHSKPVSSEALGQLFALHADHVKCIVLNACYSAVQLETIAEKIDYVIGMKEGIGDDEAIAFAAGFYQALGAGEKVEDAYQHGCVQMQLEGFPGSKTLMLKRKQLSMR